MIDLPDTYVYWLGAFITLLMLHREKTSAKETLAFMFISAFWPYAMPVIIILLVLSNASNPSRKDLN